MEEKQVVEQPVTIQKEKNKKFKGVRFLVLVILIVVLVYVLRTSYMTEGKIADIASNLMNSIVAEEYDNIRKYVKTGDGNDLTDAEIDNFLINTGLYRVLLFNGQNSEFIYTTNANLLNPKEGTVSFGFIALDGNEVLADLEYVINDKNEYIITDQIEEPTKEIETYQVAKNLANGNTIKFNNEVTGIKIGAYSFTEDANGNVTLNIIKEAKEDVKLSIMNLVEEEEKALKDINQGYSINVNDAYNEFYVYYDQNIAFETTKNSLQLSSIIIQAMNGNSNWHLIINYYNYNTKQLIKTEKIR